MLLACLCYLYVLVTVNSCVTISQSHRKQNQIGSLRGNEKLLMTQGCTRSLYVPLMYGLVTGHFIASHVLLMPTLFFYCG